MHDMTLSLHSAFAALPEPTAQSFTSADQSLTVQTDIFPALWENLKRLLFATIMSLQGAITNAIHAPRMRTAPFSRPLQIPELAQQASKILAILSTLAFVSVKFGSSAFDEWNFVYLAAIDILTAYPAKTTTFIESCTPGTLSLGYQLMIAVSTRHPCLKADALFFLDTLEQVIPVLPPSFIQPLLPVVESYVSNLADASLRPQLESAHSVFLAILARRDIVHDQILPYVEKVYTVGHIL